MTGKIENARWFRFGEMLTLFFLAPLSYCLSIPFAVKIGLSVLAFSWVMRCAWQLGMFGELRFSLAVRKGFVWRLIGRLSVGLAATYLLMSYFHSEDRFVIFSDIALLVKICLIYSLISVPIQEFVYRPFFFKRYSELFSNQRWGSPALLFVNALLFGWAHAFFGSLLVFSLTFIGGLLFAYTWRMSRSYAWVCFEHAVYGIWLFILGIGPLLAFPAPG